jgi:hypothetical protein
LHVPVHPESSRYLRTKRDRLGHLIPESHLEFDPTEATP